MSLSLVQSVVSLPVTPFVPVAVGFFGLGTGYLIYGPQELFGYPKRDPKVDFATGMWGIWMPGFMQFITGVYLFVALIWFGTLTTLPFYMAGLAFTAYGVHWFAIGWNRLHGADPRPMVGMAVAFLLISILGIIVFFKAGDPAVGGVFIGLTCIYFCEFFANMKDVPRFANPAEKALGFFHIGTGLWLMYLTWAVTLDIALKWTWLK
jgi:hypothetical protein